ncbi:hypothetical protein [Tangfeifania diversioriginum]|nr:hypothetical protein [Tangfeifania diversioriginum]
MIKKVFVSQIILSIMLLIPCTSALAQHNHSHDYDHHDEHKFHIGVGAGAASFSGESGLEPALHLHLLRKLNAESNWSLGIGYEGIIGEEWHNGVNFLVNYRPFHFLSFNAGPGIVFEKEQNETEVLPAFHAESVFEFTISGIHLGPMLGVGFNKEHTHFSAGIHLGFGF